MMTSWIKAGTRLASLVPVAIGCLTVAPASAQVITVQYQTGAEAVVKTPGVPEVIDAQSATDPCNLIISVTVCAETPNKRLGQCYGYECHICIREHGPARAVRA